MSKPDTRAWILSGSDARALDKEPLGPLQPRAGSREAARPFDLLDQFPLPLLRSGSVLLRMGTDFTLIAADGHSLSDHGPATGRFVQDLPAGPIRTALAGLSPLRSLVPLGSGKVSRRSLSWVDDLGKTQCRATFVLFAVAGQEDTALVTVSGLRGYDEPLAALTDRLAAMGQPLAGPDLLRRLFPATAPQADRDDDRTDPADRAFDVARRLIRAQLALARSVEAGVIADLDTEFLHDYRVALRKVRSVVSLFRDVFDPAVAADLKARFSALMEPTGRQRDLDVQLLERQQSYALLPPALHTGLDRKFDLLTRQRRKARDALARHLRSPGHAARVAALAALFAPDGNLAPGPSADAPALAYGNALIWKQYRKVCRSARALAGGADNTAWHDLRIICKKLRYLMEFFAPLYPDKDFRALLRPLKGLQDSLGVINDCAVQQAKLQALLPASAADMALPDRLALAQTVGALTAVLHHRQKEERHRAEANLARLASSDVRLAFRTLLQPLATERP